MDAKTLKAICEKAGFAVAHARRVRGSSEVRAYLAMRHDDYPLADELRWNPRLDGEDVLEIFHHAVKANGVSQYDEYVGRLEVVTTVGVEQKIDGAWSRVTTHATIDEAEAQIKELKADAYYAKFEFRVDVLG